MSVVQSQSVNGMARAEAPAAPWRLWGMSPSELHDAWWLRRGVRVVRPGSTVEWARRYLLIPSATHMVTLSWGGGVGELGRRTYLVAAVADAGSGYLERLERAAEAGARGIRRHYRARSGEIGSVVVTGDLRFAARWSENPGVSLPDGTRVHPRIHAARVHDGSNAYEAVRWVGRAAAVGAVGSSAWGVEGVGVERGRGVVVPGSARVAGTVVIGHGARVPEGAIIVGPAVVPDGWSAGSGVEIAVAPGAAEGEGAVAARARPAYRASKRAFDLVASVVVMAVGLPVFAGIALAIWLEDGRPVFFRQRRQTAGGREFNCLKFRTMVRDAEQLQAKLRAESLNLADGPQFTMERDPRILKVGRWLRAWQLDELPQFWNVLKGEMSVVGPRPSPDGENQCCPAWREARLSVPAGITGLWQVRRRREPNKDFQEWIRYDIEYAHRRGWVLDASIMAGTAMLFVPGLASRAKD